MSRFLNSSDQSSVASLVDKFFLSLDYYIIWIVALLLVLSILALALKQLNVGGTIGAFLLGLAIILAFGFGGLAIYLFFIVGAAVLAKLNKRNELYEEAEEIQEKSGKRDFAQVVANGGIGFILACIYLLYQNPLILIMFGASVAEAVSDTFAGEVGLLTRSPVVSILTGRPLKPGLSGGVSLMGTLAALIGSFLIAVLWYSVYYKPALATVSYIAVITLAGFVGCIVDSVLGITIQAHYYDKKSDRIVEKEYLDGKKLPLSRGFRIINNDKVNFISNLFSVGFATIFYLLIR
ncbi:MAG: DUF92 domain-containing protein [Sphaerochaetaceae bacterium]|nr:DUF92 domain-containing protein [Sphaerochaetaceae bacterium]